MELQDLLEAKAMLELAVKKAKREMLVVLALQVREVVQVSEVCEVLKGYVGLLVVVGP